MDNPPPPSFGDSPPLELMGLAPLMDEDVDLSFLRSFLKHGVHRNPPFSNTGLPN